MIKLLVAVTLLGACWAEDAPPPRAVFRSSSAMGDPANWHATYSFNSPDGTVREESILLKRIEDKLVPDIRGRSSWIDRQTEKRVDLTYEADEQGFRAEGDHIAKPEAPEVPAQVEPVRQTVVAQPPVPAPSRVPLPPPPPPSSSKKHAGHRFVE